MGYAGIRILLDPWRGDARVWLGPVSAVQVVCAAGDLCVVLVPRDPADEPRAAAMPCRSLARLGACSLALQAALVRRTSRQGASRYFCWAPLHEHVWYRIERE